MRSKYTCCFTSCFSQQYAKKIFLRQYTDSYTLKHTFSTVIYLVYKVSSCMFDEASIDEHLCVCY